MPKAKLEFILPEEQSEFTHAIRGVDYYCAWKELEEYLRQKVKHEKHSKAAYKMLDEIRARFYEIGEGLPDE